MKTSKENPNNKDLFMIKREHREKIVNVVEQQIQELKNVKVSFQIFFFYLQTLLLQRQHKSTNTNTKINSEFPDASKVFNRKRRRNGRNEAFFPKRRAASFQLEKREEDKRKI